MTTLSVYLLKKAFDVMEQNQWISLSDGTAHSFERIKYKLKTFQEILSTFEWPITRVDSVVK